MKQISIFLLMFILTTGLFDVYSLYGQKKSKEEQRTIIRQESGEILQRLYSEHPETRNKIQSAVGYGTFDNKNMNLLLLATGNGKGIVVNNKNGKETFMNMGAIGGGVGIGAKDMSVVFIFKDENVMNTFVEKGWQFGAQADATAKVEDEGDAISQEAAIDNEGKLIEIYQMTVTGVAIQATVSGTKYWKNKKLNK